MAALLDDAYEVSLSGTAGFDDWQQSIAADLDNGREALAWAEAANDADAVARIAATISRIVGHGGYRERVALAETIELLIDRLAGADLLGRVCMLLGSAFGTHQRERTVLQVRRCLARMPLASPTDAAPARWARHFALTALAASESRAGDVPAAETALVQARSLADPVWPPARLHWLLEAESFVARDRGDMAARLDWMRRHVGMAVAAGRSDGPTLANLVDAQLAAGDPAEAARTGTALVAQHAGGRDEIGQAFARVNLSAALLALDEPGQARPHLLAGWAQAPPFDLQPDFAYYIALLAALEGRPDAAARLAGYADVGNASVGEREPNEAAAYARAVQVARAALGDTAFDRLHAEGAALRDADVEALAFAVNPSP